MTDYDTCDGCGHYVCECKPDLTTYDGELDSFRIEPQTGDVLAWISDSEGYAHPVRLKRTELAGMAEASREAFRVRTVACERCHISRPAFELNNCGICVTCVMAGR